MGDTNADRTAEATTAAYYPAGNMQVQAISAGDLRPGDQVLVGPSFDGEIKTVRYPFLDGAGSYAAFEDGTTEGLGHRVYVIRWVADEPEVIRDAVEAENAIAAELGHEIPVYVFDKPEPEETVADLIEHPLVGLLGRWEDAGWQVNHDDLEVCIDDTYWVSVDNLPSALKRALDREEQEHRSHKTTANTLERVCKENEELLAAMQALQAKHDTLIEANERLTYLNTKFEKSLSDLIQMIAEDQS